MLGVSKGKGLDFLAFKISLTYRFKLIKIEKNANDNKKYIMQYKIYQC